jgi:hypothetical protein
MTSEEIDDAGNSTPVLTLGQLNAECEAELSRYCANYADFFNQFYLLNQFCRLNHILQWQAVVCAAGRFVRR